MSCCPTQRCSNHLRVTQTLVYATQAATGVSFSRRNQLIASLKPSAAAESLRQVGQRTILPIARENKITAFNDAGSLLAYQQAETDRPSSSRETSTTVTTEERAYASTSTPLVQTPVATNSSDGRPGQSNDGAGEDSQDASWVMVSGATWPRDRPASNRWASVLSTAAGFVGGLSALLAASAESGGRPSGPGDDGARSPVRSVDEVAASHRNTRHALLEAPTGYPSEVAEFDVGQPRHRRSPSVEDEVRWPRRDGSQLHRCNEGPPTPPC